MTLLHAMSAADVAALAIFAICWLGYERLLKRLVRGPDTINTHMTIIRAAWMRNMASRDGRLIDSQLLGHAITSATFFASANLIIIAAAAGALFGGDKVIQGVVVAPLVASAPGVLLKAKLALVVIALGRGLLAFVWAIRQMNYCLAAIGAAPPLDADPAEQRDFGDAAGQVLNPALSAFNAGVRGYYFALAAGAWLLGPLAFALASIGAASLLAWRQSASTSAVGVRRLRALIEKRASAES